MATNKTIEGWGNVDLRTMKRINEINERDGEMEKLIGLVALFNHMKEDDVLELPLDDFNAMIRDLGWMDEPPEMVMPKQEYEVNGHIYELTGNFHKLTTAQYLDFQSYSKSKDWEQMLSVFLVPKGKTYNNGYDVYEVQQDLLDMPVGEVLGLMGFFMIQYRSWSAALLRYSSRMLRRERTKEAKEMRKALDRAADMFGFR